MRRHKLAVIATIGADGSPQSALVGVGVSHALEGNNDELYRQAYYAAWPEGPQRAHWPNLVYWRVTPRWARYSDYDRGPLITELRWNCV